MTEVPDYLFERSRQRRVALGLISDDGSGGDVPAVAGSGGALATSGAGTADVIAAAKASAKLEPVGTASVEPAFIIAAKTRNKVPVWVLPIVFFLPLWAFVYVKLTEPPPPPITAISEGAATYTARCVSCHGGDGAGYEGGGIGRPLYNGEVLLTFPDLLQDMIHWLEVGSQGIGLGNVYGDPNRPGGPHISGETGANMPGFGEVLSGHKIFSVLRYIREVISGEDISEEEETYRDMEWEALGGGQDTGGGGGGGH